MARKSKKQLEFESLLDDYEETLQRAFLEAVALIVDKASFDRVVESLKAGDPDGALAALHIEPAAYRKLEEVIGAGYAASAEQALKYTQPPKSLNVPVTVRFDVRAPEAEAWLHQYASTQITTPLVQKTLDNIRDVMVEGLTAGRNPNSVALDIVGRKGADGRRHGGLIGLSGPQIRTMRWVKEGFYEGDRESLIKYLGLKRRNRLYDSRVSAAIRGDYQLTRADIEKITGDLSDSYLKFRGENLARTRMIGALNGGRTEMFRQSAQNAGVDEQHIRRTWSSTGDGKVRHTHELLDGVTVVGLTEPFVTETGAQMMFPGDSSLGAGPEETNSCRCRVDLEIDYFEGRGG